MVEEMRNSCTIHYRQHVCDAPMQLKCASSACFFCAMKEHNPSKRCAAIAKCFREMANRDDQQLVLVISGVWNIAMTQYSDPEFPMLGIFNCMAALICRGLAHPDWLNRDQNIYIPYYAAHIIGSYTMNVEEFAEEAVRAGVVPPLMALLRGKMSWVEQRVAVRALGHLASYEKTFVAVAEEEMVEIAMNLASTCLDVVYAQFIEAKERRVGYHRDLLTRGMGGSEMENRKAEEWASQLQCWSLHLLDCFAYKHKFLHLICRAEFLKDLCKMWGGLVNENSPAGVGLLRILCYSRTGRNAVANSKEAVEALCNLSRSSDDWQYMGIDCLLMLIKDPHTRHKVVDQAVVVLVDLVELRTLAGRTSVGKVITDALLQLLQQQQKQQQKGLPCLFPSSTLRLLQELLELKVKRPKREKAMSEEELKARREIAAARKLQGNQKFGSGELEGAVATYTQALQACPLKMRKERVVLHSNRAQCHLLARDPDAAIRDATRALCLSNPANSHGKSLWRRSQAYDMKGLGKESLLDCIVFVNVCSQLQGRKRKQHVRNIPYYAAHMINKQMNATWLFRDAQSRHPPYSPLSQKQQREESEKGEEEKPQGTADRDQGLQFFSNVQRSETEGNKNKGEKKTQVSMSGVLQLAAASSYSSSTAKPCFAGLPTIEEESSSEKGRRSRKTRSSTRTK